MNLVQLSEQLKDVPDDFLQREITQPTGAYPSYLVISEMTRRKRMRDKAMKQEPSTSVAEDLMGINAIPQAAQSLAGRDVARMGPPQQPMPPQMPPQMMPQMPPQQPPMMAGGGLVAFQNRGLVKGPINFDNTELPVQTDETGEYVDVPGRSPGNFMRVYKDGRTEIFSAGPPEGSEIPPVQTKNVPLPPVEINAQTEIPEVYSSPIIGPGDSGTMTVTDGMPQFTTQRANPFGEGVPPTSFDPYAGQGGITQDAQESAKKQRIGKGFQPPSRFSLEGFKPSPATLTGTMPGLTALSDPKLEYTGRNIPDKYIESQLSKDFPRIFDTLEGITKGIGGLYTGAKRGIENIASDIYGYTEPMTEKEREDFEASRALREGLREQENIKKEQSRLFGVKERPLTEVEKENIRISTGQFDPNEPDIYDRDDFIDEKGNVIGGKVFSDKSYENAAKDVVPGENKPKPGDSPGKSTKKRSAYEITSTSPELKKVEEEILNFKYYTKTELDDLKKKKEAEFDERYDNPLEFLKKENEKEAKRIEKMKFDNLNDALIMAGAAALQAPGGRDLRWLGKGLIGFQSAYKQGKKEIIEARNDLLNSKIKVAESENQFAMDKEKAGLRGLEEALKLEERAMKRLGDKHAVFAKIVERTAEAEKFAISSRLESERTAAYGLSRGSNIASNADIKSARELAQNEILMEEGLIKKLGGMNSQGYRAELARRVREKLIAMGKVPPGEAYFGTTGANIDPQNRGTLTLQDFQQ